MEEELDPEFELDIDDAYVDESRPEEGMEEESLFMHRKYTSDPGQKIIVFPGCKTPIAEEVTVHEAGELDGTVIRVGGRSDRAIPVTLDNGSGEYYRCSASKETAKRLATHLFEGEVRVAGNGKWTRSADGAWRLQAFEIKDFIRVDTQSLSAVVAEMRKIEGSGWNAVPDAQAELRKLRED